MKQSSKGRAVLFWLAMIVPSERLAVWLLGRAFGSKPERIR